MLTLLLGKDWTANRDAILNMIAQDVAAQKPGRILVVPELISHDTERRLCAAAGDTASRFAEVLTFTRLAKRVSDAAGYGAPECLDNGGRLVAMASATRQLHSKLKAYAALETRPEFLAGLLDAVDEFKRCCITAEDLQYASERSQGSLAQKLEELSLLLEAYDALCQRGKRGNFEKGTAGGRGQKQGPEIGKREIEKQTGTCEKAYCQ
jgi:ATP-dependent helicase/nuclease subunit B